MTTVQKLTPARKAMIKALKLTLEGDVKAAKKQLTKAKQELNKQYK